MWVTSNSNVRFQINIFFVFIFDTKRSVSRSFFIFDTQRFHEFCKKSKWFVYIWQKIYSVINSESTFLLKITKNFLKFAPFLPISNAKRPFLPAPPDRNSSLLFVLSCNFVIKLQSKYVFLIDLTWLERNLDGN